MWGRDAVKGGRHQWRDDSHTAAGQGLLEQGGRGNVSDLFGKGIDPSLEKSHLLKHPSFRTHIEKVRGETGDG